jgi:uncharacterized protein YjiS (DUF1127 family)
MTTHPLAKKILNALGFSTLTAEQQITYEELMNLSDRQLEDIGLTRGLIETVVMQGPETVRQVNPASAVARHANTDRAIGAA